MARIWLLGPAPGQHREFRDEDDGRKSGIKGHLKEQKQQYGEKEDKR